MISHRDDDALISVDDEPTSLYVRKGTRKRLYEIGRKGETFDELINRLINEHIEKQEAT